MTEYTIKRLEYIIDGIKVIIINKEKSISIDVDNYSIYLYKNDLIFRKLSNSDITNENILLIVKDILTNKNSILNTNLYSDIAIDYKIQQDINSVSEKTPHFNTIKMNAIKIISELDNLRAEIYFNLNIRNTDIDEYNENYVSNQIRCNEKYNDYLIAIYNKDENDEYKYYQFDEYDNNDGGLMNIKWNMITDNEVGVKRNRTQNLPEKNNIIVKINRDLTALEKSNKSNILI